MGWPKCPSGGTQEYLRAEVLTSKLDNESGGRADVLVEASAGVASTDPVGLNKPDANAFAQTEVKASTEEHGKSAAGSTIGYRDAAEESVNEWLDNR